MPRIVDKKKKAEAIGAAAIRVFRERGYHNTRMADIAAAVGIGKGTIYEYFLNKATILKFEIERYFSAFKAGSVAAVSEADTPRGRLLALVRFAFDHAAQWEDHCTAYVEYFGAARSEQQELFSLSRFYTEMQGIIRALLEECQASGEIGQRIDPVSTAELLVCLFDGVVLHRMFAGRGCEAESLRDAAFAVIDDGLFAAAPGSTEHRRV